MKKIAVAVLVVIGIAFTSCKKEELAKPTVKGKVATDLKDYGTWD